MREGHSPEAEGNLLSLLNTALLERSYFRKSCLDEKLPMYGQDRHGNYKKAVKFCSNKAEILSVKINIT